MFIFKRRYFPNWNLKSEKLKEEDQKLIYYAFLIGIAVGSLGAFIYFINK